MEVNDQIFVPGVLLSGKESDPRLGGALRHSSVRADFPSSSAITVLTDRPAVA
jgi:hypothetical protein